MYVNNRTEAEQAMAGAKAQFAAHASGAGKAWAKPLDQAL